MLHYYKLSTLSIQHHFQSWQKPLLARNSASHFLACCAEFSPFRNFLQCTVPFFIRLGCPQGLKLAPTSTETHFRCIIVLKAQGYLWKLTFSLECTLHRHVEKNPLHTSLVLVAFPVKRKPVESPYILCRPPYLAPVLLKSLIASILFPFACNYRTLQKFLRSLHQSNHLQITLVNSFCHLLQ